MRPSFEIAPVEYGSWTAVTSGAFDAFSTLSITAALFSASVSFSPSGAANTSTSGAAGGLGELVLQQVLSDL